MDMEPIQFTLPTQLEAHEPPEHRGLRRDHVRLLVIPRADGPVTHARFDALGDFLQPGDLLVVNTSRTLPGLLKARDEHGEPVEVRLSRRRADTTWAALLLVGRKQVGQAGMKLDFGEGFTAEVLDRDEELPFLWQVRFDRCCGALLDQIYRLGVPVHYDYVAEALPLDLYQTIYAAEPGSVEMPSAGRAFSWELLFKLKRKGIDLATLSLHTGLSSTRDDVLDASHPVYPEEYEIPLETAKAINAARRSGNKVVAVGTTVVRALETAADEEGLVAPIRGWTRLHVDASYHLKVVDSLLTGLHEPHASHLDLLSAFLPPERLQAAYQEAIEKGYLWHEFGDMNLIY
jgi:S-adenosylmethionine:tRNA ribosyltransferase-isomerase